MDMLGKPKTPPPSTRRLYCSSPSYRRSRGSSCTLLLLDPASLSTSCIPFLTTTSSLRNAHPHADDDQPGLRRRMPNPGLVPENHCRDSSGGERGGVGDGDGDGDGGVGEDLEEDGGGGEVDEERKGVLPDQQQIHPQGEVAEELVPVVVDHLHHVATDLSRSRSRDQSPKQYKRACTIGLDQESFHFTQHPNALPMDSRVFSRQPEGERQACDLKFGSLFQPLECGGKNKLVLWLHWDHTFLHDRVDSAFTFNDSDCLVLIDADFRSLDDLVLLAIKKLHPYVCDADGIDTTWKTQILDFLNEKMVDLIKEDRKKDILWRVDVEINIPMDVNDEMVLDEEDYECYSDYDYGEMEEMEEDEDEDEDLSMMPEEEEEQFSATPASREAIEKMLLVKKLEEENVEDCTVCMENMGGGDVVAVMPCKHYFHDRCIRQWLDHGSSCPICRYKDQD